MKVVEVHDILNDSRFQSSKALKRAWQDVSRAVAATDWPHGSGKFTIYPESGDRPYRKHRRAHAVLSTLAQRRKCRRRA